LSSCGSVRVGLVAAFLTSAVLVGSSCYRAEIDLTPLLDDMSLGGGGAPLSGAAGTAMSAGGGAGDAATGAGGVACDDVSVLEQTQEVCRSLRTPTAAECYEQAPDGWAGCYAGGCTVCTEQLREYPHYFDWHPCCRPNDTCAPIHPVTCNVRCPAPTEHDKIPPCFTIQR
jgi:hypothetical protein